MLAEPACLARESASPLARCEHRPSGSGAQTYLAQCPSCTLVTKVHRALQWCLRGCPEHPWFEDLISMRSTSASRGTALVAGLVALLVGCVGTPGGQSVKPAPVPSTPSTESTEAVTIADGRQIDLACRGQGEPTVVFISGTGGAADEWMVAADPSDANGVPERSERSVFETVSRTSRVCAYDRPGTTLASGQPTLTTAVAQPTSAQDGVDDLELLLASSGENPASLVLVGASWGGLIAQLYGAVAPGSGHGAHTRRFSFRPLAYRAVSGAMGRMDRGNLDTVHWGVGGAGVRREHAAACYRCCSS